MGEDDFENAFGEFWSGKECDDLNWVLYDLLEAAFAAGYRAAGGTPPRYDRKARLKWEKEH